MIMDIKKIPIKTAFLLILIFASTTTYIAYIKTFKVYVTEFKYQREWYLHQKVPCFQEEETLREMVNLVTDANSVLSSIGVPSVACYGTAVGILKRGDILLWDNNVDLCIVEQIQMDFPKLRDTFSYMNMEIYPYDSSAGHYKFERNKTEGFINVFTRCSFLNYLKFYKEMSEDGYDTSSLLCPDGTLSSAAQIIHGLTKPLPASFFKTPLPSLHIGERMINVTHGDYDIVKYQYPNTWWLDLKPEGCE